MPDKDVDGVEMSADEETLAGEEPETYSLTVTGRGVTVKRTITDDQLVTVLGIVLGGTPMVANTMAPTAMTGLRTQGSSRGSGRPAVALREFLNQAAPKTFPQKLVVLALYQRESQGKDFTGRDEFKALLQRAGEGIPKNLGRDISNAVKAGWLEEDHEELGRYYVTRTGEEAVRNGFNGDGAKTQRPRRRVKRGSKNKAEPSE